MTKLPEASWTKRADLAQLVAALEPGNARYVGGAVRDTLLGKDIHDIDIATSLLPADVIDRCKEAGIRTVPTGIDHGTVTAILPDGPVEITTLRRDVSTDGRRATVSFATEWKEDASRRDFTINALYAHPETLEISDYFGGVEDLENGRVRFIGDARERIREDHLRILRYFRFQTRFGDAWDEEATVASSELASTLKGLSRERVGWELQNLLGLPDPSPTVFKMRELGVMQEVLPECGTREAEKLAELVRQEREYGIAPDAMRRLAAIIPPVPSLAQAVSARLRLSRAQRERLSCVAERDASDSQQPLALAYYEGVECARDRLLLTRADPGALEDWEAPQLPLKGGEIVERGVGKGPQVARILQMVERRWVDEGFPDRTRVLALLDEELP
ncbi:CCA tRNA nucleotidyltransferase [Qipengyuania gelatinilytica]|uniref:CCA tRNA nucleotidyltransferase n=1 Tax=Qipengyuania gelatinilytica TaxID=2867231 RepID=A0ABX9A409_9SPHN|nr:CCA tRNA nucleotidyltransferase [Qipengyuania gelatinilytica]QZD95993.1 CCA tRNA nucleotidyltransferase [Qipengyuania gelatinilytica]